MNKEQNFISAVVCMNEYNSETEKFFRNLFITMDEHFINYEVIVVNCSNIQEHESKLRNIKAQVNMQSPLTVINMSLKQSIEQCMNAGLDICIGDYIYEFDSPLADYNFNLVWEAYNETMKGNDIVNVCPSRENFVSKLFYRVFNTNSNALYNLRTNAFRIISRRALNRVHSFNSNVVYRKAVYASTGLKISELEFDGEAHNQEQYRAALAVDSLVLYTNFGYSFSLKFAFIMMVITLAELFYTVAVWLIGSPVSGWTTTMFVLTLGLAGLFAVFAIVLKYLTLLVKLNVNRQAYLIESIEKVG